MYPKRWTRLPKTIIQLQFSLIFVQEPNLCTKVYVLKKTPVGDRAVVSREYAAFTCQRKEDVELAG